MYFLFVYQVCNYCSVDNHDDRVNDYSTNPVTPTLFTNSSPHKDMLESLQSRQIESFKQELNRKDVEIRSLKLELENEKAERLIDQEELYRLKELNLKLVNDNSILKKDSCSIVMTSKDQDESMKGQEILQKHQQLLDLSDKYQQLLNDHKEQSKLLSNVEEENFKLESRLDVILRKFSAINEEKGELEAAMDNMHTTLTDLKSENCQLTENSMELHRRIEELAQIKCSAEGSKSMALSTSSYFVDVRDMMNTSVDADDVTEVGSCSFGENMGNIFLKQHEKQLESLRIEKEKLEERLRAQENLVDQMHSELQSERKYKDELQKLKSKLESTIQSMTGKMKEMNESVVNVMKDNEVLTEEVGCLKNCLESSDKKLIDQSRSYDLKIEELRSENMTILNKSKMIENELELLKKRRKSEAFNDMDDKSATDADEKRAFYNLNDEIIEQVNSGQSYACAGHAFNGVIKDENELGRMSREMGILSSTIVKLEAQLRTADENKKDLENKLILRMQEVAENVSDKSKLSKELAKLRVVNCENIKKIENLERSSRLGEHAEVRSSPRSVKRPERLNISWRSSSYEKVTRSRSPSVESVVRESKNINSNLNYAEIEVSKMLEAKTLGKKTKNKVTDSLNRK